MPRLEDQTRLVCRPSIPKVVGILILNVVMPAGCAWLVWIMPWWELHTHAIALIGFVFFSITFVGWSVSPFRPGAVVIIGPEGIEDRRARMAPFHWNEIRRLVVVKYEANRFLAVQVDRLEDHRPPPRWWSAPFRKLMKFYDSPYYFGLDKSYHIVGFVGMSPGLTAAVTFLREQMGKHVEEP